MTNAKAKTAYSAGPKADGATFGEPSTANVRSTTTPFLRLDAKIGWQSSVVHTVNIVADPLRQQLRLGRPGDYPIAPNERFGTFGGMTLPRGISISAEGVVLLADPDQNRILYFANAVGDAGADTSSFRPLWQPRTAPPVAPEYAHEIFNFPKQAVDFYQLSSPRDVLFHTSGAIAVADTGNHRVLVYSWPDLRVLHHFSRVGSAPMALAEDVRGGLLVADQGLNRVWRINPQWQWDDEYRGGDGQLFAPVAVGVTTTGQTLVLESAGRIVSLAADGEILAVDVGADPVLTQQWRVPPLTYTAGELTYPQYRKSRCESLRLIGIEVDRDGYLKGTSLPLLARPRSIPLPRQGVFLSAQFDSRQLSGQWHRVVLQAELPRTCRLLVSTHTSDRSLDEAEVADAVWSAPTLISTDPPHQLQELLIQSGAGRYLRVKVEFLGDGFSTPAIHNIQIFGPRDSSLRYLPPPFRQDPESARFLDGLLSYFDTVREEVRFLMRDFTRYLDPISAPPGAFLDWLGKWFDWQFLAQWPADLRREMIAQSIRFFRQRGTLAGVRQMLQWHTGLQGDQPQLVEHFRLRHYAELQQRQPPQVVPLYLAELPLSPGPGQINHWFTVLIPRSAAPDAAALEQIRQIIEAQKPAHTAFEVRVFSPGIRIGKQSSVGVDTWLGNYPEDPLGEAVLGQSVNLAAGPVPGLKIGHRLLTPSIH